MKYYTGIGSRNTPDRILSVLEVIGETLAIYGLCLRSGAAKCADQAFEKGCDKVGGKKQIFLPWPSFEGHSSELCVPSKKSYNYVYKFHPNPYSLKPGAFRLHARNAHQILGENLKSKSIFVVCWTKSKGGTEQALRIARKLEIPIYNLYCEDHVREFWNMFENKILKNAKS